MILKKASKKAIVYSCINFHYSKTRPAGATYGYSVFNKKNEWCGTILYGRGGNPSIASPYGLKHGQVIELVRMALNGKQESTSKALAISLKLLKKDCPTVKLIVSYADKGQAHVGTIYQATNWIYETESKSSGYEYLYNGKWTHSRTINIAKKTKGLKAELLKKRKVSGKIKYLYPLDKEIRIQVQKLSKPYLKNICDASVNRSTLSFQDKGGGAVPTASL